MRHSIRYISLQELFTTHFVIYPLLFIGRYSLLQDRSLFASTSGFCDILSDMLFTGHGSPSVGSPADDCYCRICYNADVDRLYLQVLWERGYGGRRRATSHGPPAKARVPVYRRNLFAESAVPKAR